MTRPVLARPAVSVIPLRDGDDGIEVFVQHRRTTMDFAAGAVVFPGGRCDPEDEAKGASLALSSASVAEHVHRWRRMEAEVDPATRARTLVATGLRELEEETGLQADPDALRPWDRWVTPEWVPKRFDVFFFVLPVPRHRPLQPEHRTSEATRSEWDSVAALLAAGSEERLHLMTPTRVILQEIADLGDVPSVLALEPVITGVRDDRAGARPRPTDRP